jgi:hypothetical protein
VDEKFHAGYDRHVVIGNAEVDVMPVANRQQKISPLSPHTWGVRLAMKIFVLFLAFNVFSGCAVYYRDRESGAEHIWGFGHLATKVTPPLEGKKALIQKMTLTGVAVGIDNGSLGISVGYDEREHLLIYDENTAISIQRPPSDDYLFFKIGTYPPQTYLPDGEQSLNPNNSHTNKESEP